MEFPQKNGNMLLQGKVWIYLNDCNKKKSFCYHQREEKTLKSWSNVSKESFKDL